MLAQNVLLAREVLPFLSGRVLVQTSPTHANDMEATITHAKRLVALFEAHGVSTFVLCFLPDPTVTSHGHSTTFRQGTRVCQDTLHA